MHTGGRPGDAVRPVGSVSAMNLRTVTAMARRVDLRRPSHRLAVFATALFLVVGTTLGMTVGDLAVGDALGQGIRVGGGVFLAWAIGREIDPDRTRTARHAVFAYALLVWLGPPSLAAMVALLVALRVVLRPTGLRPTRLDLLVGIVVAGLTAALEVIGTPMGFAVAAALSLDYSLPGQRPRRLQGPAAGLVVLVVALAAVTAGTFLQGWRALTGWELGALAAGLAGTTQLEVRGVTATADATGEPLSHRRLMRTRQLLAVAVIVGVLWTGGAGVPAVTPGLAGLVGLGLTALLDLRP